MNIKKQLNAQDMSELVHLYDELKDVEYITNKPYNDVTLRDIMTMRLKLRETIGSLEKVLRDEKAPKEKSSFDVVSTIFWMMNKTPAPDYIERAKGNDDEEDCTCNTIKELIDENEHLKNQVYNLNLYLHALLDNLWTHGSFSEYFSGLPGYCPEE